MEHRTADPTDTTSLPLPPLDGLSEEQVRGAHCVYCGDPVTSATAIDLGQRRLRLLDGHVSLFPRACQDCAATAGQTCALCGQGIHPAGPTEQLMLVTNSGPDFEATVHTDPCPEDDQ